MTGFDDWTPDYPELRLMGHVAAKGFQLGSAVGVLAVAPAMAYRHGLSFETIARGAGRGALGGFGLSFLLWAGKRATIDREGVEDRAYRIDHNTAQQRVDFITGLTSPLGVAAFYPFLKHAGRRAPIAGLAGGAAFGCVAGLIAHTAMVDTPEEEGKKGQQSMVKAAA